MFNPNSLYYSDGYKVGHKRMLAEGVKRLYGTWIPRSLKHAPEGIKKVMSIGQQLTWRYINDEYTENFFDKPESEAAKFGKDMSLYLDMEYDANHFVELHRLGHLPMKVKALVEGTETDPNIPHMTFINTVDGFAWLTLYLETFVSSLSWKMPTSATTALQYRKNAKEWVMKTDPSNAFLIDWMCHDFSARGLSPWDAVTSGLGHAACHMGSDTLPVIPAARYFYDEPEDKVCIGSVNASEHSVSTTKIFTVGEKQMIIDWLKEFPVGILSIVADTFDLWKLLTEYLADEEVKALIMARDGKLVIRPDSGDPVDIICGELSGVEEFESEDDIEYYVDDLLRTKTPHGEHGGDIERVVLFNGEYVIATYDPDWNRYDKQYYFIDNYGGDHLKLELFKLENKSKGVVEILWDIFGGTVNEQGYKVLDSHIGVIYGDAITLERQVQIYGRLAAKGFASTNIVLGVGSFTYQFNTRDTMGYAAKGGWFETDLKAYNIFKDPITDDGTKKSPKGLLQVKDGVLKDECTWEEEEDSDLQLIFEDGVFYNQTTLTEIRERINTLI
jgi:nicotinamide phosphoribosyltransferase